MRQISYLILAVFCLANLAFWGAERRVRKGNELYEKKQYEQALDKYMEAQADHPESPELFFNIAGVLYKQGKYGEAEQLLGKTIPLSDEPLQAKTYYNMGNTRYRQGDLQGALDLYRSALTLGPEDEDTKYNIEFIEKLLEEMPKQQDKQSEESDGESSENEQQQDGTGDDSEKEDESDDSGNDREQDGGAQEQEESGEQDEEQGITKEQAESILRMVAEDEKPLGLPEETGKRKPSSYSETEKPW